MAISSTLREHDLSQSALLTDIATCVNYYRLFSPGLYCCVLPPVQLDEEIKLFPGVVAQVNHGKHKQCEPGPRYDIFKGPPNFIVDVFPGDDLLDYEERREAFERAGVHEYVALEDTQPLRYHWNRLVDGRFTLIEEDDPGMIRSMALPGFWVPVEALKARNWWWIMGATSQGMTRLGHHDLMESIWRAEKTHS